MNIASRNRILYTVDYLDGYQYESEKLLFFPTAEGYVKYTVGVSNPFDYVFNYTDHLGNIRLSYGINPGTGLLTKIEENNYYPFGFKHGNYNTEAKIIVPRLEPAEEPALSAKYMIQKTDVLAASMEMPPMELPPGELIASEIYSGYNYKYNGKELQDELGLNMIAMDRRQYDPAIGRFNVIDPLSELAPMHNPYRFGFNNPVYWSDPSGLFENNNQGLALCPTCPKTPGFKPLIDDPNNTYVYDPESQTASKVIELDEVVVQGKSKKSITLDDANLFNDRIGDGADILGATRSQGGSFRLTNNGSYNPRNISFKYYGSNWIGGSAANLKTFNISKLIKRGSIATTVVLGTIEVGQGAYQDYQNYENIRYTNGKNTAVATAKVGAGIAFGFETVDYANGNMSGLEYGVDTSIALAAICVSGPAAPFVATGALIYFGGKAIYEYSSGNTLFTKPK